MTTAMTLEQGALEQGVLEQGALACKNFNVYSTYGRLQSQNCAFPSLQVLQTMTKSC